MIRPDAPLQDSAVFSQLFERTHGIVYRFIFGLQGGPGHEVEDLAAETYLRAWKSRANFQGDDQAALSWLFTIARRLVIDSARRYKVRFNEMSFAESEEWLDQQPQSRGESPEGQILRHEQFSILWNQLHRLPIERRELLVLRYMLGWQVKEIATHLNIAENTASVYIRRTLEQLRQDWPGQPNYNE
jgi:RNA polymerase sigma-70 factor (ECF subfamily)